MSPLHRPIHPRTAPPRHPLRRGQVGSGNGHGHHPRQRRSVPLGQLRAWYRRSAVPIAANDNRPTLRWRLARMGTAAGLVTALGAAVLMFDA